MLIVVSPSFSLPPSTSHQNVAIKQDFFASLTLIRFEPKPQKKVSLGKESCTRLQIEIVQFFSLSTLLKLAKRFGCLL